MKSGKKTIGAVGWDIPDSKPPKPSSDTCLLGDGARHRENGSELDIARTRVDTFEQLIFFKAI